MNYQVSIVRVADYPSTTEAVQEAVGLLGDIGFEIGWEDRVLLKPNLLVKRPEACTAPEVITGVAQVFKGYSKRIQIGDSPGTVRTQGRDVLKHLGAWEPLGELGVEYVEFDGEGTVEVESPLRLRLERFLVARAVAEAEVLVNLPRPKSHAETTYTGAVKNYWGIIPGGLKARYHLQGKDPESFAQVLVDNYAWVRTHKPRRLTVMDATQVMEGPRGPGGGRMSHWGLVLAGTDEVAVDTVLLAIGGIQAWERVLHLRLAAGLGLGPTGLDQVEVVGCPIEEVRRDRPLDLPGRRFSRVVTWVTGHLMYKVWRKVPRIEVGQCVRCGDCAQICPAKAISWDKGRYPCWDLRRCVGCLCCVETCPQQALEAVTRGLAGAFDRL